ncbi:MULTISPECIES: hypothetical protein [Halobacteriales]|uniref:Uncharacterized protein n=1 Tax=Halogranum gelatinilyticum TaxID=660521 RepID=A0A1G9YKQ5_9EURY|nr:MULTISPECIES: hypothetical protein [Halobacteria]SDN09063.1 hypothetical protein SAMN04487949_3326 [Halogranum gelatinilyticum]
MPSTANRLLFGSRPNHSKAGVGISIGLFVLFFVSSSVLNLQPYLTQIPFEILIGGVSLVICSGIAWFAYQNDGLVIAWLIAFSIPFAVYLEGFLESGTSDRVADAVLSAGVIGLVYAVIVGTLGFAGGVAVRRIVKPSG